MADRMAVQAPYRSGHALSDSSGGCTPPAGQISLRFAKKSRFSAATNTEVPPADDNPAPATTKASAGSGDGRLEVFHCCTH
jgi:hypothetical protein